MIFAVEKIVEEVMGPQTEKNRYNKEFIMDVLMEYITSNSSEQYISFALDHLWHAKRKIPELIKQAKQMRDNRAKSNKITAHDCITDATVMFTGFVNEVGGYVLFITPHNKLYDVLRDDPKRLIGRIFLETLSNGIDVHYLRVGSCIPAWISSKSQRQLLRNLEYHAVKFDRIKIPLRAAEAIQTYREKYDE